MDIKEIDQKINETQKRLKRCKNKVDNLKTILEDLAEQKGRMVAKEQKPLSENSTIIIRANKIKCKHCGDIIESKHIHDFKWCHCGKVAVDGGNEYHKRVYPGGDSKDHFEEM